MGTSLLLIALIIGFEDTSRAMTAEESREFAAAARGYLANRDSMVGEIDFSGRVGIVTAPDVQRQIDTDFEDVEWVEEYRAVRKGQHSWLETVDRKTPSKKNFNVSTPDYEMSFFTASGAVSFHPQRTEQSDSVAILDAFVGTTVLRDLLPLALTGQIDVKLYGHDEHGPVYCLEGETLIQFDPDHGFLPRFWKELPDPADPARDYSELSVVDAKEVSPGVWIPVRTYWISRDLNHKEPTQGLVFVISEVTTSVTDQLSKLEVVLPAGTKFDLGFGGRALVKSRAFTATNLGSFPSVFLQDQLPAMATRRPAEILGVLLRYPSAGFVLLPYLVVTVLVILLAVFVLRLGRQTSKEPLDDRSKR